MFIQFLGVEIASLAFFGVAKLSSAIFVALTSDKAHLLISSDNAHFAAFFPALLAASAKEGLKLPFTR